MSLRTQVLRGGTYLALRQGVGMLIGLGGVLLLTRAIGPENYGLYAAALSILVYLQSLSQWGVEVYLVRREGEEHLKVYHQASTLLLFLGVGGMLLALLGVSMLEQWVRLEGFGPVAQVLFLGLPVTLLSRVPLAKLERALNYKSVALIELGGQLIYFLAALPLAFQGLGVWAPVTGWWTQQFLTLLLLYKRADYRPWFYWDSKLVKQMLGYGLGFSASIWVWHLRDLVNPLVVGRYAGAESVGYIALAMRLVASLSFVSAATWRLSIAALARLQEDQARLRKAVTEGMSLQIMAAGPLLVGFGWVAPWLLPLLFGPRWLPVLEVYPFIALSYLSNAVFNLHSSVLYVLRKNWEVTVFHFVHIAFFGGATFLLVPRVGLEGYGWAEVIALGSYGVIHAYLAWNVGSPNYRLAAIWWAAFGLALFSYKLGWWAALGVLGIALWPATWRELIDFFGKLRRVSRKE